MVQRTKIFVAIINENNAGAAHRNIYCCGALHLSSCLINVLYKYFAALPLVILQYSLSEFQIL